MKTLILAAVLLCSQTLWAESTLPTANLFAAPAFEMGVPEALVRAIAKVESGLKPWVLNIEGQAFRFNSKKEAWAKAEEAWRAGRSFDVGLMQVNNWWLKKYGIPLEAALDPVANVYFGTWILNEEMRRHTNVKAAVGAYHSPTPARASRYADTVMATLNGGTPKNSSAKKRRKSNASTPNKENAPIPIAAPDRLMAASGSMKMPATAKENSMKVHLK